MAKEKSNTSLYMISVVAIVALVAIVVIITGKMGTYSAGVAPATTTTTTAKAASTSQNMAGQFYRAQANTAALKTATVIDCDDPTYADYDKCMCNQPKNMGNSKWWFNLSCPIGMWAEGYR